jgi:hypothetical protein
VLSVPASEANPLLPVPDALPSEPAATVRSPDFEILDAYESLGDNCEFAALQKNAGVDRLALFKWASVPLARLSELLDRDLEGVDDPTRFRVRLDNGPHGSFRYEIDHYVLQSSMHTFIKDGEFPENVIKERETLRLKILRRKFLEDARKARRVYVFRSLAEREISDVERLHRSLRRHGPNRLLFVRPPGDGLDAGEVRLQSAGFAIGALDDLATYEAATIVKSTLWPHLLHQALDVLH